MIDYKSRLAYFIYFIISIALGIFLGLFLVYYFIDIDTQTADNLKILSYIFIAIAAVIGSIQLGMNANQAKKNTEQVKYSNEWNKKQLATIRLHESQKEIKKATSFLHSILDIISREPDNPYQPYEIHNKMGVFLKNGDFVFHGEETQEDESIVPKKSLQKKKHIIKFNKKLNGRKVRDNIIALLNEYEYISLNVNNDIFDFDTVKKLMYGKIIRTYKKLEKYISHLRNEHNYGPNFYIEFETLAKRLENERKNT
ncbi:DUF4760 domain-containing protein [Aliarcobacter butzleri]|uniref:DUF4760 domain-containing protein n=1 Tax=Aliarcobacter butzleri TaxID=28197 RepID=UPI003AC4A476